MSAGEELLAAAGARAEVELVARRHASGRGWGRWGQLAFEREQPGVSGPPDLEAMLGALIGDGGRVRISIEVIEPGELSENPWPPPVPVGDGSWAAWESYLRRGPARIFTLGGGFTTCERIQGIEPAPHTDGELGVKWSGPGYGGGWIALADLDGIEFLDGDEATFELIQAHGLPYRVVEAFSEKGRRGGWNAYRGALAAEISPG